MNEPFASLLYSVQVGVIPLYQQILTKISHQIAGGRLAYGTVLPSVRDVAHQLTINPMTVSKAYALLVERGFCVRNSVNRIVVGQSGLPILERLALMEPYVGYVIEVADDLSLSKADLIGMWEVNGH